MPTRLTPPLVLTAALMTGGLTLAIAGPAPQPAMFDAVADAQMPREVPATRPEQQKTEHDRTVGEKARNAPPASPALKNQPKEGKITGFDFYRDPLNADHPGQTLEEIMQKESAAKPNVMAAQQALLQGRYDLNPRY